MLPDCWQVGGLNRQVENGREVRNSASSEILQVYVGQTIRPFSRRVLGLFNGFNNKSVGERREGGIQLALADLPGDTAGETRRCVRRNGRELTIEFPCDGGLFCKDFPFEVDGLIRWNMRTFPGAATEKTPEAETVRFRIASVDFSFPLVTSMGRDGIVDFIVQVRDCRISRIGCAKFVATPL